MIQDKSKILKRLEYWMENILEAPNKNLGGWSLCPFAKKARLNNKIHISFVDWSNLDQEINLCLPKLKEKDVCVLLFDHKEINNNKLIVYAYNKNKSLMKDNYIIIVDHPEEKETLNGQSTHFEEAGIILLFNLEKLNKATMYLKDKGYFKYWPLERIAEGVDWRLTNDICE